jgi:hypothetical protein
MQSSNIAQHDGTLDSAMTLQGLSALINPTRDTANGYMLIARQYPSGDAECTSIKLLSGDSLKRGGGGKRKNSEKEAMDDATQLASVRRAKTQCRMKALTYCPDRMLTLNFRCDENHMTQGGLDASDLGECWKVFKYFSKMVRKRYKERWIYIAVPELTEAGNIHFHLALRGWWSIHALRHFWYRATKSARRICPESGDVLRGFASDTNGQVNITNPKDFKKKSWNPRSIAQYLVKYMTKGSAADFNKSRYSSGGDIPVPEAMRGWVALGVEPLRFLWDVVTGLSRRPPDDLYEVDAYFHITYLST